MKSQKYFGLTLKAKSWSCCIQVQLCTICLHILFLGRKSKEFKSGVLCLVLFVAFGSVFKCIESSFTFKNE